MQEIRQLATCPFIAARRRARWAALSIALLAVLTGCRAPTPHATAPDRTPAPPSEARPLDGSYDWHVLVIAPFGSVLKQIPLSLHEVLLFHDQARGGKADDAECYASDAPAPRFVGRTPDEYLLCFKEDRLARIQASVRLTAAEAPEVFAAACTHWLKNATQATGAAAAGAAAGNGAASETGAPRTTDAETTGAQSADACKGREDSVRFNAHLGEEAPPPEAQQPETSQTETTLSITLDSVPNP
jgi:hypothetical protein